MKLVFKTPAKINLGLFILGKRPDGYHDLETLFQMVSLYDTVELESRDHGIELVCNHPEVPTGESNLMIRAARLLQEKFPGRDGMGCRMTLTKTIPMGAGLGGGSGNAAGVLMGLNRLWDLQLKPAELSEMAARLGSDIPFFLCAPAALGEGRGERLTPLQPTKKFYVILVFPRVSLATAEVYKALNFDLTLSSKNINILREFFSQSNISSLGAHLHNDLEPVVIDRLPVARSIKDKLRSLHAAGTLVSGSGSTVFGIFEDARVAEQAFVRLREEAWDTFLTESVSSFSEFLPENLLNYS
ncbi:MAG: 4-(cytidine 5'-diphospho)-2-C-methyl-D-erythritol kinase [Nitrospinota bacterium]|nr:4-(cytidine 5'-diphospho)-2-C-methyl-D-erythritol kinase [Nitrospinota bacterium]